MLTDSVSQFQNLSKVFGKKQRPWFKQISMGSSFFWALRTVCIFRERGIEGLGRRVLQGIMGKMSLGVKEMWVQVLALPVNQCA